MTAADDNRAFYDQSTAGTQDYWRYMAAPRHRRAVLLDRLVSDQPGRVVDLGCGNGAFLDVIGARLPDAALAGIDLSTELIAQNQRRLPAIAWHALDLDQDFQPPAALAGQCDAIVAMEVIEHLDRPDDFLAGCRRLASPDGRLYLSTQSGPVRETERRVGHRRHFTAIEMQSALARAGWRDADVWNTGFPFHDLSKWYANLSPEQTMSAFAESGYGVKERAICWALRQAFRVNSRRRGAQLFAVARQAR